MPPAELPGLRLDVMRIWMVRVLSRRLVGSQQQPITGASSCGPASKQTIPCACVDDGVPPERPGAGRRRGQ